MWDFLIFLDCQALIELVSPPLLDLMRYLVMELDLNNFHLSCGKLNFYRHHQAEFFEVCQKLQYLRQNLCSQFLLLFNSITVSYPFSFHWRESSSNFDLSSDLSMGKHLHNVLVACKKKQFPAKRTGFPF